jgi:hypothetical protein
MAWTKKSGTLPDKISTLIVYDPTISEVVDLGTSGATQSNGGVTVDSDVTFPERTGSAGWGVGIYTPNVSSAPSPVTFTGTNGGGRPLWLNAAAADGTVIILVNRYPTGDDIGDNYGIIGPFSANQPIIGSNASDVGYIGSDNYTVASTGTTTFPRDTPFGVAMQARRTASAVWKYFYGTKAGGTFSEEHASGTQTINDAGGDSTLQYFGRNRDGSSIVELEYFAIIVCRTEFLSGADMNSILADPLGTLVNTGAGGPAITSLSSSNYTNGQTGITITGTGFGASQGAGSVKISPTDNVADGGAVTQTITSWGDTSITFTAVRGSLSLLTNLYLFVTDNASASNANGSVVQFYTPIALMGQAVF